MEIIDCNNHVKSSIKFFGPSCAVNSLTNIYNPLGDNSDQLCKLCIGKVPGGKCTNADPYAGYEGAFRCLVEAGEIAFLVHTTVPEMISWNNDFRDVTKDQFELFCLDGSRKPIDDYRNCNWGVIPSVAVVTSSATNSEKRRLFQRFLENSAKLFGKPSDQNDNYTNSSQNNRYNKDFYENGPETNSPYSRNSEPNNSNDMTSWNTEGFFDRNRTLGPQVESVEKFHLFESGSRYGNQRNLLFSVSFSGFLLFFYVPSGISSVSWGFYWNLSVLKNSKKIFLRFSGFRKGVCNYFGKRSNIRRLSSQILRHHFVCKTLSS